jgi:hypothetical protein
MDISARREDLIRALQEQHVFPGMFPIVLIARSDLAFTARLHAALEYTQEGAPFEVTERPSSRNSYISYTVRVHVETAEIALERKAFLSALEGVIMSL